MSSNSEQVPYHGWTYVQTLPAEYKPLVFKSKLQLEYILKKKLVVNESGRQLTSEEIELLVLGLSFEPLFGTFSSTVTHKRPSKSFSKKVTDPRLIAAYDRLLDQSDFYIMEAYKSCAAVLWKRKDYLREAFRFLNDTSKFERIESNFFTFSSSSTVSPSSSSSTLPVEPKETENNSSKMNTKFKELGAKEIGILAKRLLSQKSVGYREANAIANWSSRLIPYVVFEPIIYKPHLESTGTFQSKPVLRQRQLTGGPNCFLDNFLTRLTAPIVSCLPRRLERASEIGNEWCETMNVWDRDPRYFSLDESRGAREIDSQVGSCLGGDNHHHAFGIASASVANARPTSFEEMARNAVIVYTRYYERLRQRAHTLNYRPPVDPQLFADCLMFVMTHCFFNFQNRILVRQVSGAPLGCSVGVYVKLCHMVLLTECLIERPPSWLIFFRFYKNHIFFATCAHPSHEIDGEFDGLTRIMGCCDMFSRLLSDRESLKRGVSSTRRPSCIFHNVVVTFGSPVGRVECQCAFTKGITVSPNARFFTDRGSFVHRSSFHSFSLIKDELALQLIRVWEASSCKWACWFTVEKLTWELSLRGFSKNDIERISNSAILLESCLDEAQSKVGLSRKWEEMDLNVEAFEEEDDEETEAWPYYFRRPFNVVSTEPLPQQRFSSRNFGSTVRQDSSIGFRFMKVLSYGDRA